MDRITEKPPAPRPPRGRLAMNRLKRMFSSDGEHRVHFVYLIPSDQPERATARIEKLARDLQEWYRVQMGGKTFNLCDPVVEVYFTNHTADWYSQNNAGGDQRWWYWANSQTDLRDYAGGGFYQEFDDWVCFLDANPAEGQGAGGTSAGTYSGIAVLGKRDVDSLLGLDPEWTVCREIGGAGHEAGHSLGLPHPPAGQGFGEAIMGTGYMIYPTCVLTDADKSWFNGSPFFSVRPRRLVSDLCPFRNSPRPDPRPRPRPIPFPR